MTDIKKQVLGFAFVAFLLLGVLFGMNIMSFIFGNLDESTINIYPQETFTVLNESGYVFDNTNNTIPVASTDVFEGSFVVTAARNSSSGLTIDVANYTTFASLGIIQSNFLTGNYSDVKLDYTYAGKSSQEVVSRSVSNNSLGAIATYSNQSSTQFNTLSIAITLIILLAVFAVFWVFFIGSKGKGMTGVSGNFK